METAGVKVVNVHPANREKGLPTVMATIVLNDPKTGAPLAIMDGTYITILRTGAAGAVAAKYLARKNSEKAAIIGAGVQGRIQLEAFTKVLDVKEARVYDIRYEAAETYAKEMSRKLGVDVKPVKTVKEAVENADVIATCTPARGPIVPVEVISKGVHINAIGADAPGKQELDPEILKKADKIVVDDMEQATHSGEVNVPLSKGIITRSDIYAELGEIVAGVKKGREKDEEITIFDSTGLAIQDVATANLVYRKALEKGVGKELTLF